MLFDPLAVDFVVHHFVGGLEDCLAPVGSVGVCLWRKKELVSNEVHSKAEGEELALKAISERKLQDPP